MPASDDQIPIDASEPADRAAAPPQPGRTALLLGAIADLILPPRCLACSTPVDCHGTLCGPCWRGIRFVHPPICDRLGLPLPYDLGPGAISAAAAAEPPDFDRARAATIYDGTARRLIHLFKYSDRLEMRMLLARWMTGAGQELVAEAELIVPVPLHRRRLLWRRNNQAAALAHEIARARGIVVVTDALVRRKQTVAQVGLTEVQRRINVQGAFTVPVRRRPAIAGRRVLLVDDVITTGATVNACARALKRAGAARVDVLAVALVDAQFAAPM